MDSRDLKEAIRITADFTPEAYETLTDLAKRLSITKAETLRKALGLLSFVVKHRADNWKLVLEKDGDRKEIVTL